MSRRTRALRSEAPSPPNPDTDPSATAPDEEPEAMKIRYESVRIEYEIPRFGDKGFASSTTSHFTYGDGLTIEHNLSTRVVRIARGALVRNIPECRVLWYGDVLVSPPAKDDAETEAAVQSSP